MAKGSFEDGMQEHLLFFLADILFQFLCRIGYVRVVELRATASHCLFLVLGLAKTVLGPGDIQTNLAFHEIPRLDR